MIGFCSVFWKTPLVIILMEEQTLQVLVVGTKLVAMTERIGGRQFSLRVMMSVKCHEGVKKGVLWSIKPQSR
jgi:hypothetical protein